MKAAPKVEAHRRALRARRDRLRLPFRFGVITVTAGAPRRSSASRIALADGRTGDRASPPRALAAKWFDKSPAFSATTQNLDQLRQALARSPSAIYTALGAETPFGLYRRRLSPADRAQVPEAGAQSAGRLVWAGAARSRDPRRARPARPAPSFAADDRRPTCRASPRATLTPDLEAGLRPAGLPRRPQAAAPPSIVRHTVGSGRSDRGRRPAGGPARRLTGCRRRWRRSRASIAASSTS
jgi:hypothetical protein